MALEVSGYEVLLVSLDIVTSLLVWLLVGKDQTPNVFTTVLPPESPPSSSPGLDQMCAAPQGRS